MNVKSKMMRKVNLKASRMENLKVELAQRNKNVEAFVLKLLEELDYNLSLFVTSPGLVDNPAFKAHCVGSINERIRLIDPGVKIAIIWADDETQMRPSGVLLKWSQEYQTTNGCEPELYVDVAAALLK
jgi:hypothetical protein